MSGKLGRSRFSAPLLGVSGVGLLFLTICQETLQCAAVAREAGLFPGAFEGLAEDGLVASPSVPSALSYPLDLAVDGGVQALEAERPVADSRTKARRAIQEQQKELLSLIDQLRTVSKEKAGPVRGAIRMSLAYICGALSGAVIALGFFLSGFSDLVASIWERQAAHSRVESAIKRLVDIQNQEHANPLFSGEKSRAVEIAKRVLDAEKRERPSLRGWNGLVLASVVLVAHFLLSLTPLWPLAILRSDQLAAGVLLLSGISMGFYSIWRRIFQKPKSHSLENGKEKTASLTDEEGRRVEQR